MSVTIRSSAIGGAVLLLTALAVQWPFGGGSSSSGGFDRYCGRSDPAACACFEQVMQSHLLGAEYDDFLAIVRDTEADRDPRSSRRYEWLDRPLDEDEAIQNVCRYASRACNFDACDGRDHGPEAFLDDEDDDGWPPISNPTGGGSDTWRDSRRFPAQPPAVTPEQRATDRIRLAREYAAGARYWLLIGDAELASEAISSTSAAAAQSESVSIFRFPGITRSPGEDLTPRDRALRAWRNAVAWSEVFGAQAGILAQRRIQGHSVQCPTTVASLRRIALPQSNVSNEAISLRVRQAALSALGYYNGTIDGEYGPATSDAVRALQREFGYDETGTLTPDQTSQLVCHAAQTARDPAMQNVLGIMHATGLGVEQNTDLALEWFQIAAQRGDPDANFNLALIFGTQAVLGSYRLCAVVENHDRAWAYLREAQALGHPLSARLREIGSRAGPDAKARWDRIREELGDALSDDPDGGGLAGLDQYTGDSIASGCITAPNEQ
ncbi:MAG: peptidoglycan-binding protein [Oceanicaulis sp.]